MLRLETVPLILAAVVGLLGLVVLFDAWAPDRAPFRRERRRRQRAPRHRLGEAMIALGLVGMAAALAGRDRWPYGNVSVIAAMVFVVFGALLNRLLLRELIANRGAARRRQEADLRDPAPGAPEEPPGPPMRIR